MEKTKARRFWQEVWKRDVEKQRYTKKGAVKKGFENQPDSYLVSTTIWEMSDKEFDEIVKLV